MAVTPDTPDDQLTAVSVVGELVATLNFPAGTSAEPVTVPAWASSLEIHGSRLPFNVGQLSVTGATSAIVYLDTSVAFGILSLPVKVDVPVTVDPVVNVQFTGLLNPLTVYVVARDDRAGLNSTSQPIIVAGINAPWTGHLATAATGTNVPLVPAPAGGFGWEVGAGSIGYSAAVTAAAAALILGVTSAVRIGQARGVTGSIPFANFDGGGMIVAEAINLDNAAGGVTAEGSLWVRQVLLYFNNWA